MDSIFVILNLIQNPRIDRLFKPWIPDQVRNDVGFARDSIRDFFQKLFELGFQFEAFDLLLQKGL